MGIGLGVLLVLAGLAPLFALDVNLPYVSDHALGMILIAGGALVVVLALVLNAQRRSSRHVEETRCEGPPPAA
jgi:hypothetical protein